MCLMGCAGPQLTEQESHRHTLETVGRCADKAANAATPEKALSNSMSGLLICLQVNLPRTMPDPPPVSKYDIPPDSPGYTQAVAQHDEELKRREEVMFQRQMLMYRHQLINSAQTASSTLGLNAGALDAYARRISKNATIAHDLVEMIRKPEE